MAENKNVITSEYLANFFGLRSDFYAKSILSLEKKVIKKKEEFNKKFKQWSEVFKDIYGSSESLNQELFLKHTYFGLLLKALIIIKFSAIQNLGLDDAYYDFVSHSLEALNIFEFDKFYSWTNFNKRAFEKIYTIIDSTRLSRQDLFLDIYQQIFFTITRHKIGEFYTPSILVRKMVDDLYQFGLKVLDPSCGSGNFLIEIIVKILESKNPDNLKVKAINKVYGFDINPLAVLTAKVNIFLILLEHFNMASDIIPNINIYLIDSISPEQYENVMNINLYKLYNSFDLVIGNPPWLTYKDIDDKEYQIKIRTLAEELGIKPSSQYITHIELATIFFYLIPLKFLKIGGKIFFVITKSVLNGDHCFSFRAFYLFRNLEIWDFPTYNFFNIQYICLKAEYIGKDNNLSINDKYPINTKIFNEDLSPLEETYYSSLKIEEKGAKIILPLNHLKILNKVSYSQYRDKFFQGATLVPRTLVFFQIEEKKGNNLIISTDPDIISRAKERWNCNFLNEEIESNFQYKTFLNKDLIPFLLKKKRNVFLPVDDNFKFDTEYLKEYPNAFKFYNAMNQIYQKRKKNTSKINTLFANLNYWNKLTKQIANKDYLVIYNASGSILKSAVVYNRKKIIVGSENYYFSTTSKEEAYYLSAILNAPILSKNIKLIKSSRHIHKRPFSFPIPLYDENNELHHSVSRRAIKCESIVRDLLIKNPKINTEKVKTILIRKLNVMNEIVEQIVFKA